MKKRIEFFVLMGYDVHKYMQGGTVIDLQC